MSRHNVVVMPATQDVLQQMGEQIKLARLRRRLSAALVAERAGISQTTLEEHFILIIKCISVYINQNDGMRSLCHLG